MKTSDIKDLDATYEGIPIASLTFTINLFSSQAPSELGQKLLAPLARYRELVGDEALAFYSTVTMSKHKPVTKRALGMVDTWMKPGAKLSDMVGIEYHDGGDFNHAPSRLWTMQGREEVKGERVPDATVVRMSLPYQWAIDEPERMFELTKELWGQLPYRSGQAGFALECSRYFPEISNEYAYGRSMRHPGIDIPYTVNDGIMVDLDRIRGVGWLTLLDDAFVEQLGGVDALVQALGEETVHPLDHGVVMRAGSAPQFGDVNHKDDLPDYRAVYQAVESLMTDASEAPSLDIGGDFESRTEAWLTRFGS